MTILGQHKLYYTGDIPKNLSVLPVFEAGDSLNFFSRAFIAATEEEVWVAVGGLVGSACFPVFSGSCCVVFVDWS